MQTSTNQAFETIGLTRQRRRKLINRLITAEILDVSAINEVSLEMYGQPLDAPVTPRLAAKKRAKEHYVYIFRINGLCKIGRSADPEWRAKQLQTAWAEPVEVVHLIKTKHHGLERALHRRFHALRQRGEWYALTDADIQWIKDFGAAQAVV